MRCYLRGLTDISVMLLCVWELKEAGMSVKPQEKQCRSRLCLVSGGNWAWVGSAGKLGKAGPVCSQSCCCIPEDAAEGRISCYLPFILPSVLLLSAPLGRGSRAPSVMFQLSTAAEQLCWT